MLSDFITYAVGATAIMLAIVRGWDLLRELVPHDD